ncbi:transcriptional regulator [Streptomyces rhizosphaericus]|uniref:transcriptional regulator n=1 Tax=Streptomyces rhizosphaericus TaxID=114699 RepID=UPI003630D709
MQQAVNQGRLAPDIGAAMCSADAGDWLTFQGFEVVTSLEDLHGPSSGTVTVPDRLADRELPVHADIDQPWQRLQLYRRLLLRGTAVQQSRLLNRRLLQQMWSQRLGPPVILHVWEGRFPELRTAARS